MKSKTNQKGVTLLSLVVTIIILLILAGVALNLALSDNGIINRTQKAREIYENAANKELDVLDQYREVMDPESHRMYSDFKRRVIQAINSEGVETLEGASDETVIGNIGKIFVSRTQDATATEADILENKTAWVNGEKIVGTNKGYNAGFQEGTEQSNLKRVTIASGVGNGSYSATSIPGYQNLTADNFFFVISSTDIYSLSNKDYGYAFQGNDSNTTPRLSYDASKGVVTVSGCTAAGSNYQGKGHTYLYGNIYCVHTN